MIITIERTASKQHQCWRCDIDIEPGERYQEVKLTPGDGDVGNTRWERARQHADCPRRDPGPCSVPGCVLPADHRCRCDKAGGGRG